MIKYRYYLGNMMIEVSELSQVPEGIDYETIAFEIPEETIEVPQTITARQFKLALAFKGYQESDIFNSILQLPEPTQTLARISYVEAGTFERFNAELILVAKSFLGLNDQQIDEIFITGNTF